jgi:hypothetical protein
MSGPGDDDTQSPLSENHEHGFDEQALSQSAVRLLRPRRRSSIRPVIIFGVIILAAAIGFSILGPVDLPKLSCPCRKPNTTGE